MFKLVLELIHPYLIALAKLNIIITSRLKGPIALICDTDGVSEIAIKFMLAGFHPENFIRGKN